MFIVTGSHARRVPAAAPRHHQMYRNMCSNFENEDGRACVARLTAPLHATRTRRIGAMRSGCGDVSLRMVTIVGPARQGKSV